MTIIVGYLPAKGGRASLELGALLARSGRSETVAVTTVVPRHWATPSMAKVDAEFAGWAHEQGEANLRQASAYLAERAPDVETTLHRVEGRSVSSALLDACQQIGGDLLVVGSSSDGRAGQVVVGSTSEPLLHSSGVPIAIAPRGFRAPKGGSVTRLTCPFSGTKEPEDLLVATAQMSLRVGGALRIVTFGVRGRTMYPPEVGLHAEDLILEQWKGRCSPIRRKRWPGCVFTACCRRTPRPRSPPARAGRRRWTSWIGFPARCSLSGRHRWGALARVFLGSKAIKIVRYSPVPVVVVPAGVAAARAETAENEAARVATVHDSTPGTAQAVTGSGADPVTA